MDLVVVGIFIITFCNMLRVRIGKVWEYTIIFLLKQTEKIPTTTKKSTQNHPNEEACCGAHMSNYLPISNSPKCKRPPDAGDALRDAVAARLGSRRRRGGRDHQEAGEDYHKNRCHFRRSKFALVPFSLLF